MELFKKTKKDYDVLSLIAMVCLYIILLIACAVCLFYKTPQLEHKICYSDPCVSSNYTCVDEYQLDSSQWVVVDSCEVVCQDNICAYKSKLHERVKNIEAKTDILVADLRQETNNIINKVNGWLAFWIAVLALLGAIFPTILQITNKKRVERSYQKMVNDLQTMVQSNRLCIYINSICLNLDNKLLTDMSIRLSLQKYLANNILDLLSNFDSLLYSEESQQLINDNECHLIIILVQLGALLDQYQLTGRERRRDICRMQNQIECYLVQLLRGEPSEDPIDRMETYRRFIRFMRDSLNN